MKIMVVEWNNYINITVSQDHVGYCDIELHGMEQETIVKVIAEIVKGEVQSEH